MLQSLILKIPAQVRQTIYGLSKGALVLLSVVAGIHLVDPTLTAGISGVLSWVAAVFAPIAAAGPVIASTTLAHQRANGTAPGDGSAVSVVRSVRERAAASAAEWQQLQQEIGSVFNGPSAPAAGLDVAPEDPSGPTVTACGDSLR